MKVTTENPIARSVRYNRGWKILDIFVFVALITGVVLFPLGGLDYLCGRFNFIPYWLFRWLAYPMIGLSNALCLLIALYLRRKAFNSFVNRIAKFCIVPAGLIVPIGLFGLVLLLWFVPGIRGPSYISYIQGFRDRIKCNADIEDIRAWLKTLDEGDYSDYNLLALQSGFPESLRVFKPKMAGIIVNEKGTPAIRMWWGSSLSGVWGAVIGMEDTEIPQSDYREGGQYVLAIEPGVYVWRDLGGR